MMEAAAQSMFYSGRLGTLMEWGAALPTPVRERAPRLVLFQSRAADMLGCWEEALALTEVAERGCRADQDAHGLAYVLLHRCEVWQGQGRAQEALALGQEVLSLLEATGMPMVYEVYRIIGKSCLALGRLKEGEVHLQQALRYSLERGSDFGRSSVQNALADCLWRQGRWAEAIAVQRQAVATWRRLGNPGTLAGALNDLGFYLYSTGGYGEGLRLLEEALDLARRSGHRRNESLTLLSSGRAGPRPGGDRAGGAGMRGGAGRRRRAGRRFPLCLRSRSVGAGAPLPGRLPCRAGGHRAGGGAGGAAALRIPARPVQGLAGPGAGRGGGVRSGIDGVGPRLRAATADRRPR